MSITILSKDIQSLVQADKINNNYTIKRKILWGADGQGFDVSLATPLPVQGTFVAGSPGWSNFGQGTPVLIPVTNTSTMLLDSNPNRQFARVVNNTDQLIFIQYQIDAVLGIGVPLNTNGVFEINQSDLFLGRINAITESGTIQILVIEGVK